MNINILNSKDFNISYTSITTRGVKVSMGGKLNGVTKDGKNANIPMAFIERLLVDEDESTWFINHDKVIHVLGTAVIDKGWMNGYLNGCTAKTRMRAEDIKSLVLIQRPVLRKPQDVEYEY